MAPLLEIAELCQDPLSEHANHTLVSELMQEPLSHTLTTITNHTTQHTGRDLESTPVQHSLSGKHAAMQNLGYGSFPNNSTSSFVGLKSCKNELYINRSVISCISIIVITLLNITKFTILVDRIVMHWHEQNYVQVSFSRCGAWMSWRATTCDYAFSIKSGAANTDLDNHVYRHKCVSATLSFAIPNFPHPCEEDLEIKLPSRYKLENELFQCFAQKPHYWVEVSAVVLFQRFSYVRDYVFLC